MAQVLSGLLAWKEGCSVAYTQLQNKNARRLTNEARLGLWWLNSTCPIEGSFCARRQLEAFSKRFRRCTSIAGSHTPEENQPGWIGATSTRRTRTVKKRVSRIGILPTAENHLVWCCNVTLYNETLIVMSCVDIHTTTENHVACYNNFTLYNETPIVRITDKYHRTFMSI